MRTEADVGTRRQWTQATAIGAAAVLGLALRFARLPYIAIWSDEYHSIRVSALPLSDILAGRYVEFNPPLYFASLHVWRGWFGDGEFTLRSLSLVFAGLAFVVFLFLARDLLGSGMPLVAAAMLFAFHPMLIYFAVEIRGYSLLLLLSLVAMLSLVRLLQDDRWWSVWALGLGAGVAGSLYTHYFGFTVVLAVAGFLGVSILRDGWRGAPHGKATAAIALGVASWLPNLELFRDQLERYPWGETDRIPPQRFLNLAEFGQAHPSYEGFLVVLSLGALLAGLIVLGTNHTRRAAGAGLAASLGCAAVGALLAYAFGVNVAPRSLISLVPMAAFGVSGVFAATASRWAERGARVLGVVTLGLFVMYGASFAFDAPHELARAAGRADWRRIASAIALLRRPGEAILLTSYDATPLRYYLHEELPQVWEIAGGDAPEIGPRLMVTTRYSVPVAGLEQGQLIYEDSVDQVSVTRLGTN